MAKTKTQIKPIPKSTIKVLTKKKQKREKKDLTKIITDIIEIPTKYIFDLPVKYIIDIPTSYVINSAKMIWDELPKLDNLNLKKIVDDLVGVQHEKPRQKKKVKPAKKSFYKAAIDYDYNVNYKKDTGSNKYIIESSKYTIEPTAISSPKLYTAEEISDKEMRDRINHYIISGNIYVSSYTSSCGMNDIYLPWTLAGVSYTHSVFCKLRRMKK